VALFFYVGCFSGFVACSHGETVGSIFGLQVVFCFSLFWTSRTIGLALAHRAANNKTCYILSGRTVRVGRGCGTGRWKRQVWHTDQSLGLSHHQIRYHQTSRRHTLGSIDINVHISIYVTANVKAG
jgi:hypothetical protein